MSEWWQSLYDDTFADFYLVPRDDAELQATLAFLRHRLDLKPGDRVFDQCCGVGTGGGAAGDGDKQVQRTRSHGRRARRSTPEEAPKETP